jgi:hypothetical protein
MIHAINPTKDASVYSNYPTMNTGLDEVLEVAKVMTTATTRYMVRALIQFDLTTFPATLISGSSVGQRKFYLKLYATEPENLKTNYTIDVLPVTASWTMGSGKLYNTPITEEGVSWDYKNTPTTDTGSSEWWYASASIGQHSDYNGGAYNATPYAICSQSFEYATADANIDVTQIVEGWIAGTHANNGMLVKFNATAESVADETSYGTLKFFSKDSNTVYKPKLVMKYDDSVTGSGVPVAGTLNADDTVVYVKGLKSQYPVSSYDKIRVLARDRFPVKTFNVTQSQYVSFNYLPTCSYYGVRDAYTGEMVVDFDSQYSKLSSDTNGNFFNFDFSTLFVGRLYKFMFKVHRGTLTQYFDSDAYFKVVK